MVKTCIVYTFGCTFGSSNKQIEIMKDSWLTPEGKLIEVGDFQHNNYAYKILEDEFDDVHEYLDSQNLDYPFEVLHVRGWVRIKFNTNYLPAVQILGSCIDLTKPMRNTMDPAMNKSQLKVAKYLCLIHNTSLHIAINDKRFW